MTIQLASDFLSGGSSGGILGEAVSLALPNSDFLKPGEDYLKADYPEAEELGFKSSTIDAVALIDRPSFQNPLDDIENVWAFRNGELLIEVTDDGSTESRFQISNDSGSSWVQYDPPSRSSANTTLWRFAVTDDGQTIFAWYINRTNFPPFPTNLISYDGGVTWDEVNLNTLIDNTGNQGLTNGSSIIGATFSNNGQTLTLASYTAGVMRSEANAVTGIFDNMALIWDLPSSGVGNLDRDSQRALCGTFIIDDVDPAEAEYGNIIVGHLNGVVVLDANGLLLQNASGNFNDGRHTVQKGLAVVHGGLVTNNGGLNWTNTASSGRDLASTFVNTEGDICEVFYDTDTGIAYTSIFDIEELKWVERKVQSLAKGVGSISFSTQPIASAGENANNLVWLSKNTTPAATYVVIPFGNISPFTFHVPIINPDLTDSRGSSTIVIKVM